MLYEIARMAVRNVGRNRRRSLISGTTIAIGVTCIVFASAYIDGLNRVIENEVTQAAVGAITVQRAGYGASQDVAPLDLDMPQSPEIDARLASVGEIQERSPRIKFAGVLSNGDTSTMFIGTGFDIAREAVVNPKGPGGTKGRRTGPGFSAPDAHEAVLGARLARGLRVGVGSTVTALVQTKPGAQDALDLTVVGTFDSRDVLEGKYLLAMPLATAQRLLHMPERVTGYSMSLHDRTTLDESVEAARRALDGVTPTLEVVTWRDVQPFWSDVVMLFDTTLGIVVSVVFILALAGIVNTMLMAVFERTREVGTLMSVGFRRRRIVALFLVESAFLGAVAAIAGGWIGGILVYLTREWGLEFNLPSIGPVFVHPVFSMGFLATVVAATAAGSLVGGIYPAYRASRLRPVEALHAT